MAFGRQRINFVRKVSFVDAFLFLGIVLFIYAIIGVAQEWSSPYHPITEIELGSFALAKYSFFSLVRVSAAYLLSLAFTFSYGYLAAKSKIAEPILIPLLDILQSIPVLGFMPGLVLACVHLFPSSNLGLELAAVIMIFTGEGWNMVFSFYSSVKGVPQDLRDMTSVFRMRRWEMFRKVEVPYAMNGLLWNSMLSMAGGWFFLMTIESQTVGNHDFRLPGIGSYMAVAYERRDISAITSGIAVMCLLIIIVDRCVWAPLVVWSERFKFESQAGQEPPRSVMLELLDRSMITARFMEWRDQIVLRGSRRFRPLNAKDLKKSTGKWEKRVGILLQITRWVLAIGGITTFLWGGRSLFHLLAQTDVGMWFGFVRDVLVTFLRVFLAVLLGSLWTIPLGVFIGTHPHWTRRLQPVVQIVASFPAPMLFPIITFLMLKVGLSFEIGAAVLMLFASQWYILFNVISGATLIPRHMIELSQFFRLRGLKKWRSILFPAIFPSLVNGWISAAGGAWNACIVAEIVQQNGSILSATGIGATITQSANQGDFPRLAGSIFTMVTVVVLLNRFFWNGLYRLAETRFRLEPDF